MNHHTGAEWLIIFFNDHLQLGLASGESPISFTAGGVEYRELGYGDLTAFYDRLEDRFGSLIGVRLYPVNGTEQLLQTLPVAPYLKLSPDRLVVDVYFTLPPTPEEVVSTGDQAFGGKWFVAREQHLALSLDFGYLASGDEDWNALSRAVAHWVQLGQ